MQSGKFQREDSTGHENFEDAQIILTLTPGKENDTKVLTNFKNLMKLTFSSSRKLYIRILYVKKKKKSTTNFKRQTNKNSSVTQTSLFRANAENTFP